MAILQRQNSQRLLTSVGVNFKAPKTYRPRANVQSKLNLISQTHFYF